jgi:hypothetical protein
MKNTTEQLILVIGTALASSLLTLLLGAVAVHFYIIQPFNKEAVDRGFATWEVTDNSTGQTKFAWNEFAQAMHPDNPANFFSEIEKPLK